MLTIEKQKTSQGHALSPPAPLPSGLAMARKVNALFHEDEMQIGLVYGGVLGIGKTAYCCRVMGQAYGNPQIQEYNWKAVKKRIWHPPKQFCEYILKMKRREKVGCWDDAGLWLFALDWRNPFVMAVTKYLNVARTDWGCLLLNSPHPRYIVKRIQVFPDIIYIKITKRSQNERHPRKPRFATGYRQWELPDMKRTGVRKIFKDRFNAMLPDKFYKWYKPRRDRYCKLAKMLMLLEVKRLTEKQREKVLEEHDLLHEYDKAMPDETRIQELTELAIQHTT